MPWKRRLARSERGFALIELMVALFVAAVGITAMLGALDASRRLVTLSERKEAAVHVGEQEIERIESLEYSKIALAAAPAVSTDPDDPGSAVTAGPPATYRWDQRSGGAAPEPLVIDAANGAVTADSTRWGDGRLSGTVHRFVTWVDASCPSGASDVCSGAQDYKRVTVAVTVDGLGGPSQPVMLATKASDPDAAPSGYVSDGKENPLENASTTCKNAAGQQVECAGGIGSGVAKTLFLYDTPATNDLRQAIAGSHATHATVAPTGVCTGADTSGCALPDLLGEAPPPAPAAGDPLAPLLSYSSEWSGSPFPGGRALVRDAPCADAPSASDNTKGGYWVTPPLGAQSVLTGDGGLTLYTQGLGAAGSGVSLCVAFYDQPETFGPTAPTQIGRVTHTLEAWPSSPEAVSFTFDFRGSSGNVSLASGHRIGIRLWAASGSQQDVAAIYDHPSYASAVQLNSTAAAPPGGPRWSP